MKKQLKQKILVLICAGIAGVGLFPFYPYSAKDETFLGMRRVRDTRFIGGSEICYKDVPYSLLGQNLVADLILFDIAQQLDELAKTQYPYPCTRGDFGVVIHLSYMMPFIDPENPSFHMRMEFRTFCEQLSEYGANVENIVASNSEMLCKVVEYVAEELVSGEYSKEIIRQVTEQLKQNIRNKDIFDEKIRRSFSQPLTSLKAREGSPIKEAYRRFEEFLQIRANTAREGKCLKVLSEVRSVVAGKNQALADEQIIPLIQDLQQQISTLGDYALPIIKYALLTEHNERVSDDMIVPVLKLLFDVKSKAYDMWVEFERKIRTMYTEYFNEDITVALEEVNLGLETVVEIVVNDLFKTLYEGALERLYEACNALWVLNE